MNRIIVVFFLILSFAIVASTAASGAAPSLVNYQGRLTDFSGVPINGTHDLNFQIYDAPTNGNLLWHETHNGVVVTDGISSVALGSKHIPSLELNQSFFSDTVRWLGIVVDSDPEITPRTQLTTVPWAFRVATIDGASGGTLGSSLTVSGNLQVNGDISITPRNLYYTIHPTEFQPVSDTIAFSRGEVAFLSGTKVGQFMTFRAAVHLPNRATITGLLAFDCYNDTTLVKVTLYRQSGTMITEIGTLADIGGHSSSCEPISNLTLNQVTYSDYAYIVEVKFRTTLDSNVRINAIYVLYTLSNLTP